MKYLVSVGPGSEGEGPREEKGLRKGRGAHTVGGIESERRMRHREQWWFRDRFMGKRTERGHVGQKRWVLSGKERVSERRKGCGGGGGL